MNDVTTTAPRIILVEFFFAGDAVLLFLVRADFEEPLVMELDISSATLRELVLTRFRSEQVKSLDAHDLAEAFAGLADVLTIELADGSPLSAPGDIIWFVPHDVLHYLPLHALPIDGTPLIVRNPVCYTPSASVMKYCQAKRTGRREQIVILADSRTEVPLAHAREQAYAIQDLFGEKSELYLGPEATKTSLQQRLNTPPAIDILHVACHGYFQPDEALKSGIALAPELAELQTSSEGRLRLDPNWDLTAEEIFKLALQVDLVTLSACESGINDRRPGDELIGLTRALLYAGTPSVVVSLWAVDDLSTSILMRTFYKGLRSGLNKATALQRAQIALMNLTAEEAIRYCETARERPKHMTDAEIVRLTEDIADIKFRMGDFEGSSADYRHLQTTMARDDAHQAQLRRRVRQSDFAAKSAHRRQPDLATRIYQRPYYWAPFILVGDWW